MKKKFLIKDLITGKYLSNISMNDKPSYKSVLSAKAYLSKTYAETIIEKLYKENQFLTIETVYR